ncbi:uncharacterized protein C2845_PM16G17370 [Panicum miliaceum]|uniref:Uncharacterized protein n=1 Tax=Panicum miliaceum TaxID=4540 RepID=A0A3L6PZP0_PANMI|nr:uncharacterized protein C2845_PM16G17370 [Panicum miliaceum]
MDKIVNPMKLASEGFQDHGVVNIMMKKTRQTLGDKISQLNLAIDKAASRLKRVTGNVENEAVIDETEIEISSLNDNEHVVENLNEHGFVQGIRVLDAYTWEDSDSDDDEEFMLELRKMSKKSRETIIEMMKKVMKEDEEIKVQRKLLSDKD